MRFVSSRIASLWRVGALGILALAASLASAQTPSPALLVLEKSDSSLAIVDPASLQIVARVPAGPDPHEIVASSDGKFAYISNYGGSDSTLNTISVVDLAAQKPLPAISLGALRSAHGLAFTGGKLYFTVETNKAIGRYDPATQSIDWVLGTGQDRTHMVAVSESLDRIVTSNVNSGTISIIEQISAPNARAAARRSGGSCAASGRSSAGRSPENMARNQRRLRPRLGGLRCLSRWKTDLGSKRARRHRYHHRYRRQEGDANVSDSRKRSEPPEIHAGREACLDFRSGRRPKLGGSKCSGG